MGRFLIIWLNIFSSHEGLWDGPEVEWAGGGTGNLSWGVGVGVVSQEEPSGPDGGADKGRRRVRNEP